MFEIDGSSCAAGAKRDREYKITGRITEKCHENNFNSRNPQTRHEYSGQESEIKKEEKKIIRKSTNFKMKFMEFPMPSAEISFRPFFCNPNKRISNINRF